MRPLLLISDCHLSPYRTDSTADHLAAILDAAPDAELILNGDTWDLSCESTHQAAHTTLRDWLEQTPSLKNALSQRLRRGVPVGLVAGNHDGELAQSGIRDSLLQSLGMLESAPLELIPWWSRRGALHIEHGHVHDPDNAPPNPLVPMQPMDEPLGVALTRQFIAPLGIFAFAHAHETTPLAGLARAIRLFGARAPKIVLDYHLLAFSLVREARRRQRIQAVQSGEELNLGASHRGMPTEAAFVEQLLQILPFPTHTSAIATFKRLYLDRSMAFWGLCCGLPVATAGGAFAFVGGSAFLVGGLYLAFSLTLRRNRYRGTLEAALHEAGEAIAGITGVEHVIFGHTHHQTQLGRYVNLGSFGLPRRGLRHWARLDERGHLTLEQSPA